MIVIVGCGKAKRATASRADELYTGSLFRSHLRFAERLPARALFILSAKHGLVPRAAELDPYEQRLADLTPAQRRAWACRVADQVEDVAGERELVVLLAGRDYEAWVALTSRRVSRPFKGLTLCERRQVVASILSGEPRPEQGRGERP